VTTPRPPRIKFCGLTGLDDAQRAVEAGAWALGLILFSGSPRRCPLPAAERISGALRRQAEICGVFVNAPLDEVTAIAAGIGLTMVQLHGDEGPAYCAEVARRTGAKVMKAVRARDKASVRALLAYRDRVAFHMIDAYVPDKLGGTGETFAWELAEERSESRVPLVLSGGLTPGNVGEGIAAVRPFAVDSASGTEAAPGRKDPAKVAALMRAVEQASARVPA
jgi:phosphoribosylanthranilate isomerase